ncbi:MAG TPA: choice-of-anchor Q domain-containing protein, partial [Rhodanobacteraceae bacterium]|nr:choice-of-anchor Q domain-containing protein [Rhodanobacteraceae bacterium]
ATGAIVLPAGEIALEGPTGHALTIAQAPDSGDGGLLRQPDGTRLALSDLTLENGNSIVRGGCIYSRGDIVLTNVRVADCRVGDAGGGVFAYGNLEMDHSAIDGCSASGPYPNSPTALGGGAYVGGALTMRWSTLSGNTAASGGGSFGGAAFVRDDAQLSYSTVSGNTSGNPYQYGNIGAISATGGARTSLFNSTISGNTATWIGGFYSKAPLTIENSTIAFNIGIGVTSTYAAGVLAYADEIAISSSIISNNVAGGTPFDLAGHGAATGDHDLIMASDIAPPGTLTDDPELGPLQDNGGPTLTHLPAPGSVAVDAGSNPQSADYDQRGTAHPRAIGAAPDIGATERGEEENDTIFADGFD